MLSLVDGGYQDIDRPDSPVRGLDNVRRIKFLLKYLQIGHSTLRRAAGCRSTLNGEDDVGEVALEFFLGEQELPPHPRNLCSWILKAVAHAERSQTQVGMLLRNGNPEDCPHLLSHQFFLLLERVPGARVVQFGPSNGCHGDDWQGPKLLPDGVALVRIGSKDHCNTG